MKITNPSQKLSSMTHKETVCAHGNIVHPEYVNHIEEVSRKGWGSTFWGREGTTNWFHIPLSVPVARDGARLKLSRVFVNYHNTSRSPITAVHIYDGTRLVMAQNDLQLFGDHTKGIDKSNSWILNPPTEVAGGLGISVSVQFPHSTDSNSPRWILFTTAGAEFRMEP